MKKIPRKLKMMFPMKHVPFILESVLYWTLAFLFYVFLKFYGIDNLGLRPTQHIIFKDLLLPAVYTGALLGVFFTLIEFVFQKTFLKKMVLWLQLLIKSSAYFVILVALLTAARTLILDDGNESFSSERWWWIQNKFFRTSLVYFLVALFVFSFLQMAKDNFGKGIFAKMLLGVYKKPQKLARIFMFLDLKSSTAIAEKLGDYRYSQFIQETFVELNEVVSEHDATIYQYVGDEAVLVWTYKGGLQFNNCVEVFFKFKEQLKSKKDYYQNKYGFYPEFKASVHGGTIVFTEIGTIKKELAYHGDVINTSSRIQSLCNKYQQELLVSETIWNEIKSNEQYRSQVYVDAFLKGKDEKLTLFGVQKNQSLVS
ncbi:adenylate/guanylate cyclase domain-containing protein [Kriegella aquimaris]|uniref:Adenylate cyclase n=1 Tax=Kriegella aquimaris TaxID=192904 RepID=A0A1G9SA47_9FLAO|nr:adenylate/guanylate cyclase domain-containing protein [Kriegella aquimaris]SDM32334.1 adenylate cyclase [Kriegella aquimaris]